MNNEEARLKIVELIGKVRSTHLLIRILEYVQQIYQKDC